MGELLINADRGAEAIARGSALEWVDSPQAGVQRRMLERIGGEVAVASTIVRYAPGSRFDAHVHEGGEEFLVLEGTFSDEQGHYAAGTYVRNPPGSRHAPFSEGGCTIFVKLRQMHPDDTTLVRMRFDRLDWWRTGLRGIERADLFAGGGVAVRLERLAPGARRHASMQYGGEEIFVVSGAVRLEERGDVELRAWDWVRNPGPRSLHLHSPAGALLWRKTGHLVAAPGVRDR